MGPGMSFLQPDVWPWKSDLRPELCVCEMGAAVVPISGFLERVSELCIKHRNICGPRMITISDVTLFISNNLRSMVVPGGAIFHRVAAMTVASSVLRSLETLLTVRLHSNDVLYVILILTAHLSLSCCHSAHKCCLNHSLLLLTDWRTFISPEGIQMHM